MKFKINHIEVIPVDPKDKRTPIPYGNFTEKEYRLGVMTGDRSTVVFVEDIAKGVAKSYPINDELITKYRSIYLKDSFIKDRKYYTVHPKYVRFAQVSQSFIFKISELQLEKGISIKDLVRYEQNFIKAQEKHKTKDLGPEIA